MADLYDKKDWDILFDTEFPENLTKNQRIATRFVREDIDATISDLGLLNMGKTFAVKLIDITSKGVLIESKKKLGINQTLTLTLKFKTGKVFVIKAKVARVSTSEKDHYGIKFDKYNNELGDYLLDTQTKLVFK